MPDHPKAGEYEFGILIVWLYSRCQKDAGAMANKIIAPLPYSTHGWKSFPVELEKMEPYQIKCVEQAKIMGINFALFHWPKGSDENAVLGNWPCLIPPLNLK